MNKRVDALRRPRSEQISAAKAAAVCTLVLVLFLFAQGFAKEKPLPEPTGYLSDFAHVADEASSEKISAICRELDQKTGTQIGVATFQDMGGDEIDGFTNRLFDQWMPGQKGIDNGILIVNAISERKVRIEIGYGLESVIPDAVSGGIRRDIMTPLLQKGQYGEAYLGAVAALASIIAKDKGVTLASLSGVPVPQTGNRARRERGFPVGVLIPFGLFILVAMLRRNRYRGGGPWIGGPFIGGGFGGGGGWGGGGGGGFGGFGGGMSGGGGSSGGY